VIPKITIPLDDDPKRRIEQVGTALYGRGWKRPLSIRLGVARNSLLDWYSGRYRTPEDLDERLHQVVRHQLDLAETKRDGIAAVDAALANRLRR
jgi:hypothetical protein